MGHNPFPTLNVHLEGTLGPNTSKHVVRIAIYKACTVQQALRVKCCVFVCFDLYFRSWQAEIWQKRAQGCIQVERKSVKTNINILLFCRCGFWSSCSSRVLFSNAVMQGQSYSTLIKDCFLPKCLSNKPYSPGFLFENVMHLC